MKSKIKDFLTTPMKRKQYFIRCFLLESVLWFWFPMLLKATLHSYKRALYSVSTALLIAVVIVRLLEYVFTSRRTRDAGLSPWIFPVLFIAEMIFKAQGVVFLLLLFSLIPSTGIPDNPSDPRIKTVNKLRLSDFSDFKNKQ